jgi:hypothetical protein
MERFDLDELQTLCFELGIDYQILGGETKVAKVRELIRYCERHYKTGELQQRASESYLLAEGTETKPIAPIVNNSKESRSIPVSILSATYLGLVVGLYLPIFLLGNPDCNNRQTDAFWNLWTNIDLVIPLFAGIHSLYRLRTASSDVSKWARHGLTILSIGIAGWSVGEMIWMTYNFIPKVKIPYPSNADIAYFFHAILEVSSTFILWMSISDDKHKRGYTSSTVAVILVLANIAITYSLRYNHYPLEKDPMKLILDIFYPSAHAISLGFLLGVILSSSFKRLSHTLRRTFVFLFLGVFVMYVADTAFSATTSLTNCQPLQYYNGNWVEFIFTTAFALMGFGLTFVPVDTSR